MKENKKEKGLHTGHRVRMREQLFSGDINEKSPPHVLLEMLLYHSIPQGDTNPIAHRLINRFGSLNGVFSASKEELMSVEGVGEVTAALISLYVPLTRRVILDRLKETDELHSSEDIGSYVLGHYSFCKDEYVSLLCLRPNGKIAAFEKIADGDITGVGVSARKILEIAIKYDSSIVILAHNHPSGIALPSAIDVEVTKGLVEALRQVGVHLADHVILTDNDYVSMAQSAEYSHLF